MVKRYEFEFKDYEDGCTYGADRKETANGRYVSYTDYAALLARAEAAEAEIVRIDDLADEVCRLMNENDWSGAFRETREALRLFNRFVCNECGAQQKSTTEPFRCERCGGELETKVVHKPFGKVSHA